MTDLYLHPLWQTLLIFLQKPELANRPITLAYSGGVDSQVLLHCLAQLNAKGLLPSAVNAIHINHGLSQHALSWQQFTQQSAEQLGIPYQAIAVSIENKNQQSLEALARDARYLAIEQHSGNNALILTAHHQDDQLETMLLALKRGAGIQGLSAMQSVRKFSVRKFSEQRLIARPFLEVSRAGIEAYAEQHQLHWVEDESNVDQSYDRNFLRQTIIPLLEQRWPQIKQTASRSARHCQQGQLLLEQMAITDLEKAEISTAILNINYLKTLSQPRIINLLRFFIKQNNQLAPSEKQLQQVMNTCLSAKQDKNPEVKLGKYYLRRYQQRLHLTAEFEDVSAWQQQFSSNALNQELTIDLPDSLGKLIVSRAKLSATEIAQQQITDQWSIQLPDDFETLMLAFSHQNPKCLPQYRDKRRPLKKILQELDVPTWQRKRLPFIFINNNLAAALPLFINKEYVAKPTNNCLRITWHK
ncbi:tRNA lysidine(34) synthetase TilS [Thalassotalea sp. 42_200_T64]|nr:tRNA lysidine(34) synthetase TilS [Thalassotalea sp. 42_200_T64]